MIIPKLRKIFLRDAKQIMNGSHGEHLKPLWPVLNPLSGRNTQWLCARLLERCWVWGTRSTVCT